RVSCGWRVELHRSPRRFAHRQQHTEEVFMRHRQVVCAFAGSLVLALVLAASHRISAQQAADPNRPTSEQVAKVSLAEVALPQGAASATRFTYAQGKAMAPHTHTGRTSIITVVQGHLTEHRRDVVPVSG